MCKILHSEKTTVVLVVIFGILLVLNQTLILFINKKQWIWQLLWK